MSCNDKLSISYMDPSFHFIWSDIYCHCRLEISEKHSPSPDVVNLKWLKLAEYNYNQDKYLAGPKIMKVTQLLVPSEGNNSSIRACATNLGPLATPSFRCWFCLLCQFSDLITLYSLHNPSYISYNISYQL